MIIENKNWLDDLYYCLSNAYKHKKVFREFCVFMSDFKKCGFSYDELYMALKRSEKIAEDIIELSILTKNNHCYKYKMPEEIYRYFCDKFFYHLLHSTVTILLKDFLEGEDCAEYKEFDIFVSDKEVIDTLVEKWNHRIKNDDMWLDDETLPEELPECEPDMFPEKVYAPGLKSYPFCGSKAGFVKCNSVKGRDGKRDPEGIKTIKVICSKGCFSAAHFGTPERIPDKDTIGYMAYRWNQRYYNETGSRESA